MHMHFLQERIHCLHLHTLSVGSEVERQGEGNKSTTPRTALSFLKREEELPWVGFEPMTLSRRAKASALPIELPWQLRW